MADTYKQWLQEQIAYYTDMCLKTAAERGYPGKIRFAEQAYRDILETYDDCLSKYEEMVASPTRPNASHEVSVQIESVECGKPGSLIDNPVDALGNILDMTAYDAEAWQDIIDEPYG